MLEQAMRNTADWRVWRFEQIAQNVNDRIDNPADAQTEYYVGLEHLDGDSLKIRRWGSPEDVAATKLRFKVGDIIFGKRRAYQRKLGVAEFEGICSAHAMVLRARPENVLPGFLPFFMQSDVFMNRAVEISVGSLSPTINWKTLAKQEFTLPSIEEQAKVLDFVVANVEATELHRSAHLTGKQLLVSLLAHFWPEHAGERRTISEISEHITSGSRGWAKHYSDDGVSIFLRITNMQRGTLRLDLSDIQRVEPPTTLEARRTEIREGDVLLSITAELGLTTTIRKNFPISHINQHLALIRPDWQKAFGPYIAWYLASPAGQRQIARYNDPGAKAGMNLRNVAGLKIPWRSISEQESIARELDELDTSIRLLEERELEAINLQRAFSKSVFE